MPAPSANPTHRLPSRVTQTAVTAAVGSGVSLMSSHAAKREPSKRNRPVSVPIQRYPSWCWAMALTVPSARPSASFHDVNE